MRWNIHIYNKEIGSINQWKTCNLIAKPGQSHTKFVTRNILSYLVYKSIENKRTFNRNMGFCREILTTSDFKVCTKFSSISDEEIDRSKLVGWSTLSNFEIRRYVTSIRLHSSLRVTIKHACFAEVPLYYMHGLW